MNYSLQNVNRFNCRRGWFPELAIIPCQRDKSIKIPPVSLILCLHYYTTRLTKSWWSYQPKGVIFPWVQRSVPYSELSSDVYINQLSIPGEPSVLAYSRGAALGEWTTSGANGSCDCSVTSDRYTFTK